MKAITKGFERFKELFWYSDSEPNEALIALCHIVALPAAICIDFNNPNLLFITISICAGLFQLWAVLWNGKLKMRLIAVQIATLIAISTVVNLYMEDLLSGSRWGWAIICWFAIWNTIRVMKEKFDR